MKPSRLNISCSVALGAFLALFLATSAGAAIVPPGNSAANQYTEAFPTAGGQATPGKAIRGRTASPDEVLGRQTTQQLEEAGPAGQALAEMTAETAPAGARRSSGSGGHGHASQANGRPQADPAGSSGISQVLGETGSSSGRMGLLLPLLILAALGWAAGYWLRQRSRGAGPPTPTS